MKPSRQPRRYTPERDHSRSNGRTGSRALCAGHGKKDIRCDTVPDPEIEDPRDAIIRVTNCAICGSDLHLYDGFMPGMKHGDIMGHEFMGEVVETGASIDRLKVGDRVVVPFTIICGECDQCRRGNFSVCERTNRNKAMADFTVSRDMRIPEAMRPCPQVSWMQG